jgi:hypothetical protein
VLTIPPSTLIRELGHRRLAWAYRHRPLTTQQILRDPRRPAA